MAAEQPPLAAETLAGLPQESLGRQRGAEPIDWRIQAAGTTASDLPAAYLGRTSHPAGSLLVLLSQVTPKGGASNYVSGPKCRGVGSEPRRRGRPIS